MIVSSTLSLTTLVALLAGVASLDEGQSCSKATQSCGGAKAETVALTNSSEQALALFEKVVKGEAVNPALEGEAAQCISNCPTSELAKTLKASPAAWDAVAGPMTGTMACPDACPGAKKRVVEVLLSVPGEPSMAVAEGILAKAPRSFSDQYAVAFAEQGSKPFMKDMWKRVKSGTADTVYPAAYIVLSSKKTCPTSLESVKVFYKSADESSDLGQTVAAAFALRKAGCNEAVPALQAKLHAMTLAALDEGNVECARETALNAEYVAKLASAKKFYGVANLDWGMKEHAAKRAKTVGVCSDTVFELVEKVTPLN